MRQSVSLRPSHGPAAEAVRGCASQTESGVGLKGTAVASLTVVLLIGLALGSALTTELRTTESGGTTYSTITLEVQPVYYFHGLLTCDTVSGTAVTTYVNYGGTIGWTTIFNASLTGAVYVVTVTTSGGGRSAFYTQGPTPTCSA